MSIDHRFENSKLTSGLRNVLLLTGGLMTLAALVYGLIPQMLKPPVPDESTFIYEGWLVARGALPYRDFFEFIGPGTLYLMGGLIKLFGLRILALRLSALLAALLGIFLTCRMARGFLSPAWRAMLAVFMVAIFLPSSFSVQHHLYSSVIGLLAITCLFQALEPGCRRPAPWTAAAGMLTGLCLLFTQSLGGLLGITLGGFILIHRWQTQPGGRLRTLIFTACVFGLPALVPVLGIVLFFASRGALDAFYYDTVGWLLQGGYARTTSHWYLLDGFTRLMGYGRVWYRRPDIFFETVMIFVQGFLPVLGLLWAGQLLAGWLLPPFQRLSLRNFSAWRFSFPHHSFSRLSAAQWQFFLVTLTATAFFMANFSYPNTFLVLLHGWLQYALAFGALRNLTLRFRWLKLPILGFIFAILINRLVVTDEAAWHAYRLPGVRSYGTVEKVLSPVGMTPDGVAATNSLLRFLHDGSPSGESLFIYNGAPEFYFMTNRRNPTRYQILMALYNPPEQIAEAVADLERKAPEFILYNQLDTLNFQADLRFIKLRNYDYRLHSMEQLLQKRYILAGRMGNLLIFQLQPAFKK